MKLLTNMVEKRENCEKKIILDLIMKLWEKCWLQHVSIVTYACN